MHAGVFIYRHSRRQKYKTSSCIGAWSQSYLADSPVAGPSSCTFSVATSIKRAAVSYGKSMLHRNHIWLLSLSLCCLSPVAVLPLVRAAPASRTVVVRSALSVVCVCLMRDRSHGYGSVPSSRVANVVDVECCPLRSKVGHDPLSVTEPW